MDGMMYNTIPYVVKKGDNLTKISRKLGVSIQDLIRANPDLRNPDRIFTGQELRIPIPGEIEPMDSGMGMDPASMLGENQVPLPRVDPMSHPMGQPDPEQIRQQLGMGALAGAAPMAAMMAPMAGPAAMGGLGRLATMAPRLPPAGRVDSFNMKRGAVPHPGAAPSLGNVRPYPDVGGMPASRAAAQGALRDFMRMQSMEPRGMGRVPFDPSTRLPIRPGGIRIDPTEEMLNTLFRRGA